MLLTRVRFAPLPGLTAVIAAFVMGIVAGAAISPGLGGHSTAANATAPTTRNVAVDVSTSDYPVEVLRVVDGDTFEARVHVWPGMDVTTKVRLRNIDAPEMRGRCAEEIANARAAREALAGMLSASGASIRRVGLDKYGGRVLADAATDRVADVANALLEAKLVRRYSGGRRESWCVSQAQ